MNHSNKKAVGLIGSGNLCRIIIEGIQKDLSEDYYIKGIFSRNLAQARQLSEKYGFAMYTSIEEFTSAPIDITVEAATSDAVKQYTFPILSGGTDLIVLSTGAFADTDFFNEASMAAKKYSRKIYMASGAIGGFDLMQAAGISEYKNVCITTEKPPSALAGAPCLENKLLSNKTREIVFTGSAKQAISAFPKNVNVAVSLACATDGLDNTKVEVISNPEIKNNVHTIHVTSEFMNFNLSVEAKPSVDNPRSSVLAAHSVLAKLKNLASGISFC